MSKQKKKKNEGPEKYGGGSVYLNWSLKSNVTKSADPGSARIKSSNWDVDLTPALGAGSTKGAYE